MPRISKPSRSGGAVAVIGDSTGIGRIPPHLLPNRGEVDVTKRSPVKRGTTNRQMIDKAQSKQCPYGWHVSPERRVTIEEKTQATPQQPQPVMNQDTEVTLMKQQLAMALEQVRGLRDENKTLKTLSPRNLASPGPVNIASPGQPLDQFLSNIDEVINHHERIAARTLDYSHLKDETIVSPARAGSPLPVGSAKPDVPKPELLELQLKHANETILEQRERIFELEKRLTQREDHIDQLTRSLIDLGQHNAKIQAQIRGLVNEPAKAVEFEVKEAPIELPVGPALQEVTKHQSKVKKLDEEVKESFDKMVSGVSGDNGDETDFKAVLSAIEEHRERADQIVSLNKQSMGMLKEYYLDEQVPPPPPPPSDPYEILAQDLLDRGEWVKRHDAGLDKTYFYNPHENLVSWDLVADLQQKQTRSISPQQGPSVPMPSSVFACPISTDRSQSPRRSATTAILTGSRDMSPPPASHVSSYSIPVPVPLPIPTPVYSDIIRGTGTG